MKAATSFLSVLALSIPFQSTPPVKAATCHPKACSFDFGFQSTPPVKAATISATLKGNSFNISIHAAREGGDKGFIIICKMK